MRACGSEVGLLRAEQLLKRYALWDRFTLRHDRDRIGMMVQRSRQLVDVHRGRDDDRRARVLHEMAVVLFAQERIDRSGHGTNTDRAEERHRERRRVVEQEQHPLLSLDAK